MAPGAMPVPWRRLRQAPVRRSRWPRCRLLPVRSIAPKTISFLQHGKRKRIRENRVRGALGTAGRMTALLKAEAGKVLVSMQRVSRLQREFAFNPQDGNASGYRVHVHQAHGA